MSKVSTENASESMLGCMSISIGIVHHDFKSTWALYEAIIEDMMKEPHALVRFDLAGGGSVVFRLSSIHTIEYTNDRFMVETADETIHTMTTLSPRPVGVFPRGHA